LLVLAILFFRYFFSFFCYMQISTTQPPPAEEILHGEEHNDSYASSLDDDCAYRDIELSTHSNQIHGQSHHPFVQKLSSSELEKLRLALLFYNGNGYMKDAVP